MAVDIDAAELANKVTVTVNIRRSKQFQFRIWLALRLIRLAQAIAWINIEVNEYIGEPWWYECPKCAVLVEGYKPALGDDAVFTCQNCNYQFLTQYVASEPHVVKERWGEDYDEYGCHWTGPYGFVPMAGCPIHD